MRNADQAPLLLNVNDTLSARYLVTRLLQGAGYRVIEATTGQEALSLVHERAPDLVVLDIRLPDIDGYEICRRLKADPATASTTIIQTSAMFVSGEQRAYGLDSGADGYLAQPFDPIELVAMVRSLLRLRKTEQESREKAMALSEADRRKDEFLAMLAHELRNPLSAVMSAVHLLEQSSPTAHQGRLLGTVHRQARHLGRLIDDLLDVSRITRGKIELKREPIELVSTLGELMRGIRPMLSERGLELSLKFPEAPVWTSADATRLEQIVRNLVGNAVKYSRPGGRVTFALEERAEDGSGTRAVITVSDDGIGIAPEHQRAVFDLFFQVDTSLARSQSGLGVGLTLVQRLVELHEGRVRVASEGIGKGTSFEVNLPATAAPPKSPRSRPSTAPVHAGLGILLIDDNVDACEMYKIALEQSGHRVDTAHDGQEGLERALAGTYDVIVVDIGLPLIDGYEVGRRIRAEKGSTVRLLAVTGYGRPEDRERSRRAGFDAHLVKPVDVRDLERTFETLLGASRPSAAPPA